MGFTVCQGCQKGLTLAAWCASMSTACAHVQAMANSTRALFNPAFSCAVFRVSRRGPMTQGTAGRQV
ncbi:hypothetical protein, partial [Pseudomonas syringae]|uniref:hypothetical protein n=1 Tax=Pseudomonas syringae TaxID=317 RepID=UPI001B31861C